jgi:hypothetical protein
MSFDRNRLSRPGTGLLYPTPLRCDGLCKRAAQINAGFAQIDSLPESFRSLASRSFTPRHPSRKYRANGRDVVATPRNIRHYLKP